ncbi:cytochrome c biogenesis protein CcdA [Streptobacillus felis]|uniref:cytochrome c biogenesis CcdA family protein n=1 Tax=Streptobacillus felis TaxID=1384509 RepID=UPI00082B7AA0|nr:cytochrome c biogenesis protein CcdA [Streptobacillus felis]
MLLIYIFGIMSFLTPCFMSIIPIYLTILTKKGNKLLNVALFFIGLSTTFVLMGLSFSFIGIYIKKDIFRIIAGIYILFMGLIQLEIFNNKFFDRIKMIKIKDDYTNSYYYSYILGFTFSMGWIPCITSTLSSILLSISVGNFSITKGIIAMLIYFFGLITPFIISTLIVKDMKRIYKYLDEIKTMNGFILIILGLLMIFNLIGVIGL